jgi:hypothetical protein
MHKPSFALTVFVCLSLGAPVLATEPGTPMDCSDLELAAGLTCAEITSPLEDRSFGELPDKAIDNDGRVLALFIGELGTIVGDCGPHQLRRRELVTAFDGEGNGTALVTATDRCVDPSVGFAERIQVQGALFDAVRGSLVLHLSSHCQIRGTGQLPGCPYTGPRPSFSQSLSWIARIDGFAPLSHVLPPQCRNGVDDDGDGQIDAGDQQCKSDADNDESRP